MSKSKPAIYRHKVIDFKSTKQRVLNWAKQFSTFCFLDNHQYQMEPHSMECMLAAGVKRELTCKSGNALNQLQSFIEKDKGWLFGHLAYDLKNETESVASSHPDHIGFPDLFFFEPEILILLTTNEIVIEGKDAHAIFLSINNNEADAKIRPNSELVVVESRLTRDEYVSIIHQLQQHILRGDCYEINFCQEFFARYAHIDPVIVYEKLSALSPNPFSALYKTDGRWLICASPERYLKKEGSKILSQPIKGTAKRFLSNAKDDRLSREHLLQSAKDRSENVMVVDLVRNDLSKICTEGSVTTNELFGVYPFPQVHQMISTISGELKEGMSFEDIIRATFPMGSMTGAPKKSVVELIEKYETTKRGIFSGALGYISPEGNFDFNVVIRSIMYNVTTSYLSFQAGSGITFYSDAEQEWEECMVKAAAIIQVLQQTSEQI